MTVKKGNIDFSKVITQEMRDAEEFSRACTNVRDQRDSLLREVVWMLDRNRDEIALELEPSMPADQVKLVLEYVQELRDVPQQDGFPHNVEWPIKPI